MSDEKRLPIKNMIHKANKGDIKSCFQLYDFYKNGKYVEKDESIAQGYAKKILNLFEKRTIKISKIKLIDYRGFISEEIKFSKGKVTVVVGANGAGKTALLDAIQKCLSWLTRRIVSEGGSGDLIDLKDIRVGTEYATIIAQFLVENNTSFDIELSRAVEGSNLSRKNTLMEINLLSNIYKLANSQNINFNFPLMAYYSVERSTDINAKDINYLEHVNSDKPSSKFAGYARSLNGTADFKLFFKWFKDIDDINNANTVNNESNNGRGREIIHFVKEAIYSFLPEFNNLRIQRQPTLDLIIEKKNTTLSVLQLSQGEKSLLALVADISRRLVLLNPSLDNPLNGNGVVLIDEIDLHLHPAWQQKVIPFLVKTFPNLQLIISTHSPQVLSTVDSSSIEILEDGKFYSAPKGIKGAESSRILKRIFGVDPRPLEDENTKMLKRYEDLVYKDRWECEDALELRVKLDAIFSLEEPKLTELDLYIENRTWEISLEKN